MIFKVEPLKEGRRAPGGAKRSLGGTHPTPGSYRPRSVEEKQPPPERPAGELVACLPAEQTGPWMLVPGQSSVVSCPKAGAGLQGHGSPRCGQSPLLKTQATQAVQKQVAGAAQC